jgi:hypothetical protein
VHKPIRSPTFDKGLPYESDILQNNGALKVTEKGKVLGEKSVSGPLCLPQMKYGPAWE